ncbi:MAG TPA: proton-conducting transporter membrane subunit [Acidimicrobiales bacterium]|nr:proton-conducting transporter membrane subunit [Acidimicrobiales bacterium]
MSAPWIALPFALPLLGAAVSVLVGRSRAAQRAIGIGTLVALLGVAVRMVVGADDHDRLTTQAGGWPAPMGISLAADRLTAIMLLVSIAMLLVVLLYSIGQGDEERRHVGFHPVYLTLVAGVSLSFLTADLFNLFVAFEVMLVSSYVLLTLGGRRAQVRAGTTYVVISLLASVLFLTTLGLLYRATGTVNMADLPAALGAVDADLRRVLLLLFLGVFGIKAAIFPLFFWLPDSYPSAPTAVTAVFAGLLTKVGVYAMIRIQTLIGADDAAVGNLVLVVAGLTMVVGVFGALSQQEIKRILSFHIISQIGYMLFGLGLLSVAGIAAAILYIVHHIVVKTTLFLTGGLVERASGTGHLDRVDGMVRTRPLVGMLFLLPALSLAGVPPFSGFVAKFALVDAGVAGSSWAIVGVSLLVSVFTLLSMNKIWSGAFLGEPTPNAEADGPLPIPMVATTVALVVTSIAIAFASGPIHDYATRAAETLLAGGGS